MLQVNLCQKAFVTIIEFASTEMLKVQIQKYRRETIAERANTEIQEGGYLAQIHSGLGVAQVRQLPVVLQQYNTVFLAVVMRMMVMKIDDMLHRKHAPKKLEKMKNCTEEKNNEIDDDDDDDCDGRQVKRRGDKDIKQKQRRPGSAHPPIRIAMRRMVFIIQDTNIQKTADTNTDRDTDNDSQYNDANDK